MGKYEDSSIILNSLRLLLTNEDTTFRSVTFSTVTQWKNSDFSKITAPSSPVMVVLEPSDNQSRPKLKIFRLKKATMIFDGKLYTNRQMLDRMESENVPQVSSIMGKKILQKTEGDFSFSILEKDKIIVGRDTMGVQPLYYGENEEIAALASSRKPLLKIGIEKPQSFPPGNLARVSKEGFEFVPVKTVTYREPKHMSMEKAAEKLKSLLEKAIRKRVEEEKKVAVAFSGGLDSSLIAVLAKKYLSKVRLFHVSLENQTETVKAKKAASVLNLPIRTCLYTENDVENDLPKVIRIIEDKDPVNASIGVPLFWTAGEAAKEGFHTLLAGQGADELFGGYQRYLDKYLLSGDEAAERALFTDICRLHETNIERDAKICLFHNLELRVPFASYPLVEFATEIPIMYKMDKRKDSLRKIVLRKVAERLKLPLSIVNKPKKAIQYSTGVNKAIKKIAKRENMTVKEYIERIYERYS